MATYGGGSHQAVVDVSTEIFLSLVGYTLGVLGFLGVLPIFILAAWVNQYTKWD